MSFKSVNLICLCVASALLYLVPTLAAANSSFTRILPKVITNVVQHPQQDSFSIAFKNPTAKTFVLRKVSFDCECLAILGYKLNGLACTNRNLSVEPNDSVTVDFAIYSAYYTTPKYLPLYFYFKGLTPAMQITKIYADFKSVLSAKPEKVAAVIPQGFSGLVTKLKLSLDQKVEIIKISAENPQLTAKFSKKDSELQIFTKNISKPITNSWINLELKGSNQNLAKIFVSNIVLTSPLSLTPTFFDFGIVTADSAVPSQQIILSSKNDTSWKITGIHAIGKNANAIKTRILSKTNDCANTIAAVLDGKLAAGYIESSLVISTDHPYASKLTIPIKGQIISNSPKPKSVK